MAFCLLMLLSSVYYQINPYQPQFVIFGIEMKRIEINEGEITAMKRIISCSRWQWFKRIFFLEVQLGLKRTIIYNMAVSDQEEIKVIFYGENLIFCQQ